MLPQPAIRFVSEDIAMLVLPWLMPMSIGQLHVMPGATTDGASTGFASHISGYEHFRGDTFPAAFAHDQLYATELVDRETADGILRDLLIANGVSPERAEVYFAAVRMFGGDVWAKHTPESIAQARQFVSILPLVSPAPTPS